jgi:hypothetical protein
LPIPDEAVDKTAFADGSAATIGTPDDLVKVIKDVYDKSGGFGTVIGFVHDWANPEDTRRSWDMVARYVIPEINGYVTKLRESQKYLIENRAVFERAQQAIMAKIMQTDGGAEALKSHEVAALCRGIGRGPGLRERKRPLGRRCGGASGRRLSSASAATRRSSSSCS